MRIRLLHGRMPPDSTPAQQTVTLADGSMLAWDKLLIATGAHPVRPPIPGIDLPQVLSCWTLADARRIAAGGRPGGARCCRWAPVSSAASSWSRWPRAARS
jgi:NADPH-dependent 2,4-dienoyl-CoA reductase/sulfur reductase-like enzyme